MVVKTQNKHKMSGVVLIPFRLAKLPLSWVKLIVVGVKRKQYVFDIPVSGLDEGKAQSIYFALQRASSTERVRFLN